MKPIRTAALLLILATLGACGLKGGLEKPPPQFGEARRQYDAEQKAKADAAEKAKQEKTRQTVTIPAAPATPTTPPPQ
jgi:predicted small lipoprotein YifL